MNNIILYICINKISFTKEFHFKESFNPNKDATETIEDYISFTENELISSNSFFSYIHTHNNHRVEIAYFLYASNLTSPERSKKINSQELLYNCSLYFKLDESIFQKNQIDIFSSLVNLTDNKVPIFTYSPQGIGKDFVGNYEHLHKIEFWDTHKDILQYFENVNLDQVTKENVLLVFHPLEFEKMHSNIIQAIIVFQPCPGEEITIVHCVSIKNNNKDHYGKMSAGDFAVKGHLALIAKGSVCLEDCSVEMVEKDFYETIGSLNGFDTSFYLDNDLEEQKRYEERTADKYPFFGKLKDLVYSEEV